MSIDDWTNVGSAGKRGGGGDGPKKKAQTTQKKVSDALAKAHLQQEIGKLEKACAAIAPKLEEAEQKWKEAKLLKRSKSEIADLDVKRLELKADMEDGKAKIKALKK